LRLRPAASLLAVLTNFAGDEGVPRAHLLRGPMIACCLGNGVSHRVTHCLKGNAIEVDAEPNVRRTHRRTSNVSGNTGRLRLRIR